jgi:hypothetical protein
VRLLHDPAMAPIVLRRTGTGASDQVTNHSFEVTGRSR